MLHAGCHTGQAYCLRRCPTKEADELGLLVEARPLMPSAPINTGAFWGGSKLMASNQKGQQ